jgi:demethylspheroidene O-methyltransferase
VVEIFARIRRAMAPGGALVIAEPMSGVPGAELVSDVYFAFYLLAMGSGRPRSPAELERLLRAAGFASFRRFATARPMLASVLAAIV